MEEKANGMEEVIGIQGAARPGDVHHEFSPSRLQQFKDCPGAYRMQLGIPEEESEYAEEGRMLHERVATGNLDGLDPEQEAAVASCIGFLKETAGDGAVISHEVKTCVTDGMGRVVTEGTADVVFRRQDGTVGVIDWKFGRNEVAEVGRNMQLAAYSLGVMQQQCVTSCEAHVFQPRIHGHTSYTFSKPLAILSNINSIVARCRQDALVLNAGDCCRYCTAKGKCPAYAEKFNALARTDAALPSDAGRLAELYARTKMAERFIKDVKTAVEKCIEETGSCGPYVFRERPGNREVKDIAGLFSAIQHMVTHGEFLGACKASVSGITDILVAKLQANARLAGKKLTKADAKRQVDEVLDAHTVRGASTRTIVEAE